MIDFDRLVLSPNQNVWGRVVTVDPIVSRPGAVPYSARGIFTARAIDVIMQDGGVFSDRETTLDIRLSEFAVAPYTGDKITINNVVYAVGDIDEDGQGGAKLMLRALGQDRI